MAEVLRIAEPVDPAGTPLLPQNIEAEAALLGALMIDNRLVEDVQLKLRPDHFFEPLHGHNILGHVNPLLAAELLGQEVDQNIIKVLPSQEGVPVS